MNQSWQNIRYIRLITLVIPLFLVCLGMRVPDLSRPHKPKPMRRAVIESSAAQLTEQSVSKADSNPFIPASNSIPLLFTEQHSPLDHPVLGLILFTRIGQLSARAPPAPNQPL